MPHFRKHSNEATAKAAAPAAAAGAAATHGHGAHEIAGHTTPSGNHLIPGMEGIGSGYSGTAAASGDITAPTGTLPPGMPMFPLIMQTKNKIRYAIVHEASGLYQLCGTDIAKCDNRSARE